MRIRHRGKDRSGALNIHLQMIGYSVRLILGLVSISAMQPAVISLLYIHRSIHQPTDVVQVVSV